METAAAFYCFINLGWRPRKFLELDEREKALICAFIQKDTEEREQMNREGRRMPWQT